MKLDYMTLGTDLEQVRASVHEAERRGFDGWFTGETSHDPLLMAGFAGERSERLEVGTAIAVAFPRSPMHVAYTANDLQQLTGGRFVLGLGSQVKAHIERRFSSPWSQPAERMREFVAACKAIWRAWNEGEKLDFRGDFYQHTLMTPFFAPEPNPHGAPKVLLAAVGPRMTEVAGEVADGVLCHSFTTVEYLRDQALPALERGLDRSGRDRSDLEVCLGAFVVPGHDEQTRAKSEQFVRGQIAFYGSTPAYRPVLEAHGWGELQSELNALSKRGEWGEMPGLVDDEVLDAFAVRAEPAEVGDALIERFGGLVDRLSLYTSLDLSDEEWTQLIAGLRSSAPTSA